MRKVMNLVIGGIQHKVFNLVLVTIILLVGAYTAITVYQYNNLSKVVGESGEEQMQAISDISSQTMHAVVENATSESTMLQAVAADEYFRGAAEAVEIMGDYASMLLENPRKYTRKKYLPPDASLDGELTVQFVTAEGVDEKDAKLVDKVGLMMNMSDFFLSVYQRSRINSCLLGFPEGAFLITDEDSGGKFDEDGTPMHIDITDRPWYKGAVETGELFFSDVMEDAFTGQVGIVVAKPVYKDGEVAAVIGADLFLDSMDEAVKANDKDGSFTCIVNQEGHIIFSPREEGEFAKRTSSEAEDLRESGNSELAECITDALSGDTSTHEVDIDGKDYYVTAGKMSTTGWAILSVVDKAATEQSAIMMQEKLTEISENATENFRGSQKNSRNMTIILLLLICAGGIWAANYVSKRIVSPLNKMTKRISELNGTNLQFKMEDDFRTGDEIEVLAESFADISRKTVQYMEQIRSVTAEKERISAELSMAQAIQASQLPSIFPAYPERDEFDIYASMTPAKEVGGDFYDFFLCDPDHLCMVMADVSGKGVPAALFMMISKILIKNRVQTEEELGEAMRNVSNQLLEGNRTDMFVTAWVCVLQLSTGEGIALNAGHEHPARRSPGGKYALVTYKHSIALATFEDAPYREHSFKLDPGDSIFVYTDGVPEANNSANEFFGTERMLEALNKNPDASPQEIIRNVTEGIEAFTQGADQFDDITMLSFKYLGPKK